MFKLVLFEQPIKTSQKILILLITLSLLSILFLTKPLSEHEPHRLLA